MRRALAIALLAAPAAGALPAAAAETATLSQLLRDGYEIKAAFADNTGGAYVMLQRGTSAFMCHSNPNPTCEKLN